MGLREVDQAKLKIESHIFPDPSVFEEAMEGPLLLLSSQHRLRFSGGAPARSQTRALKTFVNGWRG
jgi:hypothetical protein